MWLKVKERKIKNIGGWKKYDVVETIYKTVEQFEVTQDGVAKITYFDTDGYQYEVKNIGNCDFIVCR